MRKVLNIQHSVTIALLIVNF